LLISGYGFLKGTVSVKVDNKVCDVISQTATQVKCVTQASSPSSTNSLRQGEKGLIRTIWNDTATFKTINVNNFKNYPASKKLHLHAEAPMNVGDYYG
jgi:hypothetical protein